MLWLRHTLRSSLVSFAAMSSSSSSSSSGAGLRVLISHPEVFASKKAKFVKEGPSKLQIFCDWDYTLTRFHLNGKRGSSCHKVRGWVPCVNP